jgi:hypothetical protein
MVYCETLDRKEWVAPGPSQSAPMPVRTKAPTKAATSTKNLPSWRRIASSSPWTDGESGTGAFAPGPCALCSQTRRTAQSERFRLQETAPQTCESRRCLDGARPALAACQYIYMWSLLTLRIGSRVILKSPHKVTTQSARRPLETITVLQTPLVTCQGSSANPQGRRTATYENLLHATP